MTGKKALFFCAAASSIDPKYNQAAREAVRAACLCGYEIVSGGTTKGTMKVVSDTARECGARVKGVLPRFMEGLDYPDLDEKIWTDTMAERKEEMRRGVSLAVALPGGIGTLDELAETCTLVRLHQSDAKIVIFNVDGFYDILESLFDHYVETGMLDVPTRKKYIFVRTIEEFKKEL
ncbi:MAG: TIGR00730 family Rossman fold protein [Bacteroidales bacterium]|nr:TIGR00730 family Rossman fold protein [Bacteroidales bacterium]